MSRQPNAGAVVGSPSEPTASAPAPQPSSPLSPQRYSALRARYNALLVTLYERSTLTVREIAAIAGRTDRAVLMLARAQGCPARQPNKCRPGTNSSVRRAGPRPPPLNAPATRRLVAAFAEVARELVASPQAREASEVQRAKTRMRRRAERATARVMLGAARELFHLAAAFEHTAAARASLAAAARRKVQNSRAGKTAQMPKWPSRDEMWRRQQRVLRQQEMQMYDAHAAARAAKAAKAAAPPEPEAISQTDGRANAIAERFYAERPRGPRIRGL